METFLILSTCILPCAVYLSIGTFAVLKQRTCGNIGSEAVPGLSKDISTVLFLIACCYLVGCAQAFSDNFGGVEGVMDRMVFKIYIISSVIPFLMLRRFVFKELSWIQFYLPAGIMASLILVSDILILIGDIELSFRVLCRGAVTVNLLVFLVSLCESVFYGRSSGKARGDADSIRQECIVHIVFLSLYNFLFLFYSFGLHALVDYFIMTAGFVVIHSTIAVAWAKGRSVSSTLWKIAGRGGWLRYGSCNGYLSGNHGTGSPLIEDASCEDGPKDQPDRDDTGLPLKERLLDYFECEKPYLSKNLTMEEVAMRLFTNKSYLSKTINMEMNKNFRELVNYFRVKEAVRIFSSDMDISMNELRDKCGFNNNASFTSAFKLNTGFTPGEWCRDMRSRRIKAIEKDKKCV